MKRFLFGFLAVLFLILNTIPYLHILADDMPTSSQYEMLGAYALSTLITSGEATELDFSDYTENDTSFLIDLGEAIFTGDWSGLAEDGLEWLGETADSIYDSYKEYVSQWKSDHLGIMYSNWFPDETIYVGPDDSYSLAKPLRQLLTPRSIDNNPDPQPDPDFSFINNINTLWSAYYSIESMKPEYDRYFQAQNAYNPNDALLTSIPTLEYWSVYCPDTLGRIQYQGDRVTYPIYTFSLINIYLTTNQDSSISAHYVVNQDSIHWTGGRDWTCNYFTLQGNLRDNRIAVWNTQTLQLPTFQSDFVGISTAINYVYQHFYGINLYVDNVPWAIFNNNEPTYPIVIPGQLTIWNNQPLEYSFPADTHIDLPDLTNIIRNAINSSGVVMWSDIADVFVDVNGQTAVAVTKIVRNDYDNLYMEQYPYPAMLVGMTDQTKFNEHLLDNSHAYLSPMGTVVQETVNVLPAELVGVLAIGAILTIFAVIINRLLE